LDQADAWLESVVGRAREIHLFTDLQRVSLEGREGTRPDARAGDGVSLIVHAPQLPQRSNGTPGVPGPEVVPLTAGRGTRISVPLHWFGPDAPVDPVIVRLVVREDVIAVTEARFGEQALLTLPPQDSGWVQGYVEIDHHGLAADDRRFFTWFVRPPSAVAVLGELGDFTEHALEALESGGRLRRERPAAAEVWMAAGGEGIADGLADGHATVVIPPASPLDLPLLNARLEQARIPWRYEIDDRSGSRQIGAGAPVEGVTGLEVRRAYGLVLRGTALRDTVLLRLGDGSPWLVRGTGNDDATYLLLASPLTPEASDLPVSAVMIPFWDALIGDWSRRAAVERTDFEGAAHTRLPDRARRLRLPDGSVLPVEGGAPLSASEPGTYAVLDGGTVGLAFSVNAPLREADLAAGRREELEAFLPAASWSWIQGTDAAEWTEHIFRTRRGKLAWRPLVVVIILVSIVEAALAAAGRRRAREAGRVG
jgi:hypothetical protein